MKKIGILFCFTVLLSGLSYAAGPVTTPPPDYKGAIAEQPKFTSGDYWEYETAKEQEKWMFVSEENGEIIFEGSADKRLRYTNLGLVTLKEVAQDGKVMLKAKNPSEGLQFPLWVGKSWHSLQQNESPLAASRTFLTDVRYTVAEYKSITVKAGTFEAFKIVRSWHAVKDKRSAEGKQSGEAVFWYAPAAKNIIKYENSHPNELVAFKIAGP